MKYFGNLSNVNPLECILMKNQQCKVRPEIVNANNNNPMFQPFSIRTNKCSSNCNNINDPYARICLPDTIKKLNVKVFNLISLTNETRYKEWHETCKSICRLDKIICNNKQRWNEDKCRCECKELIDKAVCNKGFIWNPSNWECECNKSCDIGEYLDYSNCKCRKKLVDLVKKALDKNENKDKCNSYIVYKVLVWIFFIFLIISIKIGIYFVYCKYFNHNKYNLPY